MISSTLKASHGTDLLSARAATEKILKTRVVTISYQKETPVNCLHNRPFVHLLKKILT